MNVKIVSVIPPRLQSRMRLWLYGDAVKKHEGPAMGMKYTLIVHAAADWIICEKQYTSFG